MKQKIAYVLIVTGPIFAAVLFCGCATDTVAYVKNEPILFERVPSKDAYISEVYAYEEDGELVIYGKVKRTAASCCDPVRGYVDIALVDPEGFVLDAANTMYTPRNIPKVRSRSSSFRTTFPHALPDGVTIKVAYHSS